ncbi:lipocalin-like domain-containing protein [Rhizobium leguminosarum]|uniref:lipocalin-like domain-containing protein n=1 Tax=Rhizobium leguminosarum TaxID=384 RepID=UPI0012DA5C87
MAFRSMLAYSGQYRVEPPNRLVTTVDIAWFEPWVGSEQVRYCNLSGDSLTLTSAPLNMPQQNALMFAVVTWRRELASQCD